MESTIKSGRFIHPFQFILPFGLPSTFEGEYGSIEYSLDAVIGQSWAFDYKSHARFHVVGVLDLNSEPTAQVPIIVKAYKTFGVIFQSGPLDITLRIPRGGAVPGEYVPFIAEIFNKSDKTVTEYLSIQQVNIVHYSTYDGLKTIIVAAKSVNHFVLLFLGSTVFCSR